MTAPLPCQFQSLARYNAWANAVLCEDLAAAPASLLLATSPVNFGSILGILNHLLLCDQAWLHRFTGQGPCPGDIASRPHPTLPELLPVRQAEDARIIHFASTLTAQALQEELPYRDLKGTPCARPFALLVSHFFNHQTHHRGQVHALAETAGSPMRNIDLIYCPTA